MSRALFGLALVFGAFVSLHIGSRLIGEGIEEVLDTDLDGLPICDDCARELEEVEE
jgi:hypothetical protein